MNKLLLSTALSLLITAPAFAAGTHGGGHDDARVALTAGL